MDQEPKAPEPGDVYVFPVKGAGTGICRVLARDGSEPFRGRTFEAFRVELALWEGAGTPSLEEALAAETCTLTCMREMSHERPACFRVSWEFPDDFRRLGRLPSAPPSVPTDMGGSYLWAIMIDWLALEARYRAHPENFRKDFETYSRDAARRAEQAWRRRPSKDGPQSRAPTLNWQPGVPPEAIAAGTRLLETFHADLGRARSARAKAKAVRACVEGFNRLDETSAGAIDTVVAEELFGHLVDSGEAAGLEEVESVIEEVREF